MLDTMAQREENIKDVVVEALANDTLEVLIDGTEMDTETLCSLYVRDVARCQDRIQVCIDEEEIFITPTGLKAYSGVRGVRRPNYLRLVEVLEEELVRYRSVTAVPSTTDTRML